MIQIKGHLQQLSLYFLVALVRSNLCGSQKIFWAGVSELQDLRRHLRTVHTINTDKRPSVANKVTLPGSLGYQVGSNLWWKPDINWEDKLEQWGL